jgi:hypothetical protein
LRVFSAQLVRSKAEELHERARTMKQAVEMLSAIARYLEHEPRHTPWRRT